MKIRCQWASSNPELATYHDEEWGVAIHEDKLLFEHLSLGGAQAGLSWLTILKRRDGYRKAFASFDTEIVSCYSKSKIEKLLKDPGIIRNRLKVQSVVHNASLIKKIVQETGSLDQYLWQFTGGKPIQNSWKSMEELPVSTNESDAMSRDLKQRGFKFIGTTICYAFMQAVGMVNDHTVDCFRYKELRT